MSTALQRLCVYVAYAFPMLLAVVVYGYSITLPLFLDDGPHIEILALTDGVQHWGSFPAFPYYRPFTFSVWQISGVLTGGYDPVILHALNMYCFGLCGVLAGQIVRRVFSLGGRWQAVVLAGCGVVVFPVSYQAVAMVAALFHLITALGMLLACWCALMWLDARMGWPILLLGGFSVFAAVFSHENGVLLPVFMAGLLFVVYRERPPARGWQPALMIVGAAAGMVGVYLLAWSRFSPGAGDGGLSADPVTALVALLQGLVYPLIALVSPLIEGDAAPELILLFVAGAVSGGLVSLA